MQAPQIHPSFLVFLATVLSAGPGLTAAQATVFFQDVTASSGIDFAHHDAPPVPPMLGMRNTWFGTGAAVSDYDRDGDQDVYLCASYGWPNRLFRNNGDGTFTDATAQSGLGSLAHSHMALFLDLDNDGFDDLVVLNDSSRNSAVFPRSQIYRNRGDGTFEERTHDSGFDPTDVVLGGATASDYDKDGDLDLFVVGWHDQIARLYRNEGGFRFTDVTAAAGAHPATPRSQWTPVFADVDGDGWQDLFCAVDFDEDYLLRNNKDGTFTDVSAIAGTLHVANDMGAAVADIDGDLDLDIYTTNVSGESPDMECEIAWGCNMLYLNRGDGTFADRTRVYGIGDTKWAWGVALFDADLDGDRDLAAVNGWMQPHWLTPPTFFLRTGTGGAFADQTAAAGLERAANTRSLVPFDYDGDGDLDLLMVDVMAPAVLYENRSDRADNAFLIVEAAGRVSNRNGIGTRVYVRSGAVWQMHEIIAGGSFYAGPPLEAHFGLGPAAKVDTLLVVFPSGRRVLMNEVAANQRIRVVEPLLRDR